MMIHLSRKHRLATMKSIDIDIPLQEGCFRIIFEESNVEFILTQCFVHNKTLNIQTLNLPFPEVPLRQTVLSRIKLDLFYWGCAKKKKLSKSVLSRKRIPLCQKLTNLKFLSCSFLLVSLRREISSTFL